MEENKEIAQTLDDLADAVQDRGELIFRVRSYRRAATAIRALDAPLSRFNLDHDLREIPGVGPAIAKKIDGMLESGPRKWLEVYLATKDGE